MKHSWNMILLFVGLTCFLGKAAADTDVGDSAEFSLNTMVPLICSISADSNNFSIHTSNLHWDLGAGDSSEFEINTIGLVQGQTLQVTPASLDFGSLKLNSGSLDKPFTVRNAGTSIISGTASVAAPFGIIGGGTYSLAPGNTKTINVRFAPTTEGTFKAWVSCTGGSGAMCQVKGYGYTPQVYGSITGNVWDEDSLAPLTGARISAGGITNTSSNGTYTIQKLQPGYYTVSASCGSQYQSTYCPMVQVKANQATHLAIPLHPFQINNFTVLDAPVVLVRGYGANKNWNDSDGESNYFANLRGLLDDAGFTQIWDCNLPEADVFEGNGHVINGEFNIQYNSECLLMYLQQKINKIYGGKKPAYINIVAHSMGGLFTRDFLLKLESNPIVKVNKVVMLSTPNEGSPLADFAVKNRTVAGIFFPIYDSTNYLKTDYVKNTFNPQHPWINDVKLDLFGGSLGFGDPSSSDCGLSWGWRYLYYFGSHFEKNDGAVLISSSFAEHSDFLKTAQVVKQDYALDHYQMNSYTNLMHDVINVLEDRPPSYILPNYSISSKAENARLPSVGAESPPQQIELTTDTLFAGHQEWTIPNDSSQSLGFCLSWGNPGAAFSLRDPVGRVIEPSTIDPNITYFAAGSADTNTTTALYQIKNPAVGVWTVLADTVTTSAQVGITAFCNADLTLAPITAETVENSDVVAVTCCLTDGTSSVSPATTATLTATITKPDSSLVQIPLFDDGLHSDGLAGDGVFAADFADTHAPGHYAIAYRADGITTAGLALRRVATGEFVVGPAQARLIGEISDEALDLDGDQLPDHIRISVLVNVPTTDTYTICGTLSGVQATTVTVGASEVLSGLPAGKSYVSLYFDMKIGDGGLLRGNFVVTNLQLFGGGEDQNGWRIGYAGNYTTATFPPRPTVTLTTTALDPTAVSPIPVTVTFSYPVIGFTASDLILTNATAMNFTGSGAIYQFNLVPVGRSQISATIPAGAAVDLLGDTNLVSDLLTRNFNGLLSPIWIDFGYNGIETGSQAQPYKALAAGVSYVLPYGTMKIQAGHTSEKPRITKPMHIEAVGGLVRLGASN